MQIQQAYLDAQDGLVRSSNWLYFHGNHFRWNLINPHSNPTNGENFHRFTQRLSGRIPDLSERDENSPGFLREEDLLLEISSDARRF